MSEKERSEECCERCARPVPPLFGTRVIIFECGKENCECHTEKEKHKEGWRERFDEEFALKNSMDKTITPERVKSFIEKELAAVREEARKEKELDVVRHNKAFLEGEKGGIEIVLDAIRELELKKYS